MKWFDLIRLMITVMSIPRKWLKDTLQDKTVMVQLFHRDQYNRAVQSPSFLLIVCFLAFRN